MNRLPYLAIALAVILTAGGLYFFRSRPRGTPAPVADMSAPVANPKAPPVPDLRAQDAMRKICAHPYRTICQKTGVTRDPTGVVRRDISDEVRALRLYEETIRKHPKWTSDQVDNELVDKIYTKARVKRIENASRWVKKTLIGFIEKQPDHIFSKFEKNQLKLRLLRTKLQLPPPASVYGDERDLFTKNDVFFERIADGELRLRVGGAYVLGQRSYFNLIFTLAHELGHVIDPCELTDAHIEIPVYSRIEKCFLDQHWIADRPDRVRCGTRDQLPETFADWIAVTVTTSSLSRLTASYDDDALTNSVINSVRDLCEQEESLDAIDIEQHPSPEIRINDMFFGHPVIQSLLRCPTSTPPEHRCQLERIGRN